MPQVAMCCKHFGRIHRRKLKETTNKAAKKYKTHLFGHLLLRLKHKILTEMMQQ